jgi:hypothetical protein
MNLHVLLWDSLFYPFRDCKRFLTVIILMFSVFLVIPGFLAGGYFFRVVEATLSGQEKLPSFDNKKELLVNGLKYLGWYLFYSTPCIMIFLTLFLVGTPVDMNSSVSKVFFSGLSFLIAIVSMMGLANMVHENRFMAAFNFIRIFQLIKIIKWKKYLIYIAIYCLIMSLLTKIPSEIIYYIPKQPHTLTLLLTGVIILYTLLIYSSIFSSRFIGLIYPPKE